MNIFAREKWMEVLSRLNSILLKSDRLRNELTAEALSAGWCGSPPAPETEILRAERRLGITLPPSYRSFLSISDGWRPLDGAIERVLSVQEIERFESADPEKLAALQEYYREDEISDDEYLDYETPRYVEALRLRYYPESILVGKGWGVEDDMILLNPQIISNDGEWEAIFFANWIPGNQRYRSFFEFVKERVSSDERFVASTTKSTG